MWVQQQRGSTFEPQRPRRKGVAAGLQKKENLLIFFFCFTIKSNKDLKSLDFIQYQQVKNKNTDTADC